LNHFTVPRAISISQVTIRDVVILIGDLVAKATTELYTAVFRCGGGCVQLPKPPWMGS
jgi:hypothetical protein